VAEHGWFRKRRDWYEGKRIGLWLLIVRQRWEQATLRKQELMQQPAHRPTLPRVLPSASFETQLQRVEDFRTQHGKLPHQFIIIGEKTNSPSAKTIAA